MNEREAKKLRVGDKVQHTPTRRLGTVNNKYPGAVIVQFADGSSIAFYWEPPTLYINPISEIESMETMK